MRRTIKAADLKVGDRIRITRLPGLGVPGYYLHSSTKSVFKRLIARKRSVRIRWIDEYGAPWYVCRFRMKNGKWDEHQLAILDSDDNWTMIESHKKNIRKTE